MQNVFLPFAPRDRADLKHFRTRTASSRTRVVMPVVPDREVATVIMLGVQFVQLAHAWVSAHVSAEFRLMMRVHSKAAVVSLPSLRVPIPPPSSLGGVVRRVLEARAPKYVCERHGPDDVPLREPAARARAAAASATNASPPQSSATNA